MANKIVLISDDLDFFDYIRAKLVLRKSDELFAFSFDEIPERLFLLETSVLIVNSESSQEKTLDLLNILKDTPVIVSAFNDDEEFKNKAYKAGMFDFITLLTSDIEFQARLIPALTVASLLEKNKQYRDILVNKNIMSSSNEVFTDYNYILEQELKNINLTSRKAVFAAISPNEKTKFLLHPTVIETFILNNIRKNDILMNYASNKYFLLIFDIEIDQAKKLWNKISGQISEKLYAGFVSVSNQGRQQIINKALNELHLAINQDRNTAGMKNNPVMSLAGAKQLNSTYTNFKMFRQEFGKKIEQVITPVFYQIQQKYSNELSGVTMQQGTGEGYGTFYLKSKNSNSSFRITSPGFSKINIDITFQKDSDNIDAKRITLEPEELEAGLLEDLLEQFITEYKTTNNIA